MLTASSGACRAQDQQDTKDAPQRPQKPSIVPVDVPVSRTVRALVDDTLLKPAERERLKLFHGLINEVDEATQQTAAYALATWRLNDALLNKDDTPVMLRARAAYRRGDLSDVAAMLADIDTTEARLLRGTAQHELGLYQQAIATLSPLRVQAEADKFTTAADLTNAAEAIAQLAILEGRAAQDYHTVIDLLGKARQADRLYWPAMIAEANVLVDKDNAVEAVSALHEALTLNGTSSEAWYQLGRIALRGYNFPEAVRAMDTLRKIEPHHPLADVLEAESYLLEKDPNAALHVLDGALKRYPNHHELRAAQVAAAALLHNADMFKNALAEYDKRCGKYPLALYTAGRYMSLARQYDAAEKMLKGAIEQHPNWVQPQLELGLLLNQSGKEAESRAVLRPVVQLDPFNKRAANVLKMLEDLAEYHEIETPHFVIKYRDPIDSALAGDMPDILEGFHAEVTSAFGYSPKGKTAIEIMPDKKYFAVRITGMPDIWTIGAATGPVIALTPPREGRNQSGAFDWARVLRHEFVHTVTLEQTGNRIPHWFTEACAVSQEPGPRDYSTCKLLAGALANNELFDLDQINWAFVRPQKPTDRAQAYAQAHWMYQYITAHFGHDTILKMLDLCKQGVPQPELVPTATGQDPETFLAGFKKWAHEQVVSWGLAPTPTTQELLLKINEAGGGREAVEKLMQVYPDHPDLLQWAAVKSLEGLDDRATLAMLLRYATARPVDPWADEKIAEVAMRSNQPELAVPYLENLDLLDQTDGSNAVRLLSIYRKLGRLDDAQRAAHRALMRQPYNATLREAAATVALQRRDNETALRHVRALTVIEPELAIHETRLAALLHRMGKVAEANAAALKARELDPKAPVDPFLKK
ncbi:MAG: tetratricopeptide repeat protein [Phycisphaera sp.]|nr:tetratricopeptide repeat protein [Phycisphaera sp.]